MPLLQSTVVEQMPQGDTTSAVRANLRFGRVQTGIHSAQFTKALDGFLIYCDMTGPFVGQFRRNGES